MFNRSIIGSVALAAALCMIVGGAQAFDESKYPDLKGQWQRTGTTGGSPAQYRLRHVALNCRSGNGPGVTFSASGRSTSTEDR